MIRKRAMEAMYLHLYGARLPWWRRLLAKAWMLRCRFLLRGRP
jgi:hypothetical protein